MAEEKNVIPTPQTVTPTPQARRNIPLEDIHDLPGILIRKRIDKDLGGLVQSVRSQGIMEPVVLRLREDGKFQMVAGYRRLWASELAGKKDIPADVRDMTLTEAQSYAASSNGPDKSKTPIPGKPVLLEKPNEVPAAPAGTPTPVTPAVGKKPDEQGKTPSDSKPAPAGNTTPGTPTEEKKPDAPDKTPGNGKPAPTSTATPGVPAEEKKPDAPYKTPGDGKTTPAKSAEEKKPNGPIKADGKIIEIPIDRGNGDKASDDGKPSPAAEEGPPAEFSLPLTKEGQEEKIVRLKIEDIHDFPDHPFEVRDDKEMKDMAESVRKFGVLVPATVIPRKGGGYEMVSGHRRKHAALLAGLTELPSIVRQWDRDEAIIAMVDSNLQRENISPMEKARAYKMKLEAMKRKSGPLSRVEKEKGVVQPEKRSDQLLAEQVGESRNTVQRLIRLNELVPDLQEMVDSGKLPVNTAVELSFVPKDRQEDVADMLNRGHTISGSQATELKEASKKGELSTIKNVEKIVDPPRKDPDMKVVLSGDRLRKYFPDVYMTPNEVAESIYGALEARRQREQKHQQLQEKNWEKGQGQSDEQGKAAATESPKVAEKPAPKVEPPKAEEKPAPKVEPPKAEEKPAPKVELPKAEEKPAPKKEPPKVEEKPAPKTDKSKDTPAKKPVSLTR